MNSRTVVTIAVTAFAGLIVVGWGIPAFQGYRPRSQMTDVINELARVRSLVAAELQTRRPGTPARREVRSETPMVTRVAVDLDAKTISAFVDTERFGRSDVPRDASVTYTAVGEGAQMEWKCTATVPGKYLPANCR